MRNKMDKRTDETHVPSRSKTNPSQSKLSISSTSLAIGNTGSSPSPPVSPLPAGLTPNASSPVVFLFSRSVYSSVSRYVSWRVDWASENERSVVP